jgi:hypothetical protein
VHTNAGEMTLDANLTVAGGSTSFTNLASGLIEGDATLNVSALAGGLLNQGTISPGLSPGILTVQGNYSESATALLAIELGGTTVGTTFDRLAITGNASLAGLLQVTLINGFVPTSSDVFTILTAGTRTGDFANALAQLVTGFGVFDVVYAGNSVSLTNFQPLNVVPEPSTILLSAIGAGAFAIARARRRRA